MKFNVTLELATLLRTLRTQNNVSAKELATHLEKSPSFISKLESGMVKFIKKETLTDIFLFLSDSDDFYGEVLPNLFRVLRSFMEDERISAQSWLLQYDVVERSVSVPPAMAEDLAHKLEDLGVTAAEFVAFINENVDSETADAFPVNQMVAINNQGGSRLLIRSDISLREVEHILSTKETRTELMTLLTLIYTLFRFSIYGKEKRKMPPDLAIQVLKSTDRYLEQYGIRSLISFSQLTSSEEYTRQQIPLLSSVPASAQQLIADISSFFGEISAKNPLNTAKILQNFADMLAWDPAFTMKLLGLPFTDLEGLSYQNKRKLLEEITELLNRYDSLSDFEKKWEDY